MESFLELILIGIIVYGSTHFAIRNFVNEQQNVASQSDRPDEPMDVDVDTPLPGSYP